VTDTAAMAGASAGRPPVNILLVDDQPGKLLSYEAILSSLGENLIRASSGKEALQHLLNTDIAVLLVDVCMPDLDGFELAAMIRSHPRFKQTAIILVSGVMVEDRDRLKGYDSGAVDYVSVPIIPEILRAKVSVFADLFRKNQQLQYLNQVLEQRVAERTSEIRAAMARLQEAQHEAETANRLKDEFLATLSHELRTPLNAITGWAHLLRGGALDEAGRVKAVETITRNARLQSQLISDILDVSRIIAGKVRLELDHVDLRATVEAALDGCRPAAAAKNVRMVASFSAAAPMVYGDADRLQQVITNLLSNAIKFGAENGRVDVTVQESGSEVEVVVQDDGPGIRADFLPFIFDRFRQADPSTTRTHRGLGLGLAIARHLMDMHGGHIEAQNRADGPGAVFRMRLPRLLPPVASARAAARRRDESRSQAASAAPSLQGIRVLVVDDEPDARELAATVLERYGAEVKVAASAAEAFAIIGHERIDVLVTDIEMPGEDGYGLLRRVRALPPGRGRRMPAGALTAFAGAHDREKVLAAGFQVHLPKPVLPADLAAAVAGLAAAAEKK
jgi:signal transduction histidine kinase